MFDPVTDISRWFAPLICTVDLRTAIKGKYYELPLTLRIQLWRYSILLIDAFIVAEISEEMSKKLFKMLADTKEMGDIAVETWLHVIWRLEVIVYARLTRLWLLIGVLSISSKCFFRIFNGVKYKCTTMPWAIWPALVVLWGVCWMFYGLPIDDHGLQGGQDATGLWLPDFEDVENESPWSIAPETTLADFDLFLSDRVLQDPGLEIPDLTHLDLAALWTANAPVFQTSHIEHGWPLTGLTTMNPMPTFEVDHRTIETSQTVARMNGDNRPMPMATLVVRDPQSQESVTRRPESRRRRIVSCEICNLTFQRTDVLKRHRHEKHETEELLCPHKPCKRSEEGSGFKLAGHGLEAFNPPQSASKPRNS